MRFDLHELTLRPLTMDQEAEVYFSEMGRDFPASELKSWASIAALWTRGCYEAMVLEKSGQRLAYAFLLYAPGASALLLDYLAVLPAYRDCGLGREMLRRLAGHYQSRFDRLLIEAEAPCEAPDEAVAQRRLRFYASTGALDQGFEVRLFGVRFCILALPLCDAPLTGSSDALRTLYRAMLPGEAYDKSVAFL